MIGHSKSEKAPLPAASSTFSLKVLEGVPAGHSMRVHIKINIHFKFLVYALNVNDM